MSDHFDLNRESDIEHRYKFNKKLNNDHRYGEFTILRNPQTSQLIMMKEKVLNTKDTIKREILQCQDLMNLQSPFIIELLDYSTSTQNDFCSTFYKIRLFYEYESNDMQREIKQRQSQGRCFTMEELTHLLYNMIESGAYLQKNDYPHGDIRPCYLHITEKGNFKLGNRSSDGTPAAQHQINIIVSGKHLYMAPALYVALKRGNLKVNFYY
jgi:serine/threonine protein kinase